MPSRSFILEHLEEILQGWEAFAKKQTPASDTMDASALRDHAKQMLQAIAKDIDTWQSEEQQTLKSQGADTVFSGVETAAAAHGLLRHAVGFDLKQLVAEFRALRATVLRLWVSKKPYGDPQTTYEIARFNEAIDQALAESVSTYSAELGKSRDTFLAMLGHDLRTPLGAVVGAFNVLSNTESDAKRAEALSAGTRSAASMGAMIRDLLEYTRTRLGKGVPIARADANIETVSKSAIVELSTAYPQTAFRFECGGALQGSFDSARIHQAIANLLYNAVQHGKRGTPVLLIAGGDSSSLSVQVKHQGPVTPQEQLQVIFDPLVQVPTAASDPQRFTNLGLGLFIAREIVLAHGGTIGASSSVDGTTFNLRIPRVERRARRRAPHDEGMKVPASRRAASVKSE